MSYENALTRTLTDLITHTIETGDIGASVHRLDELDDHQIALDDLEDRLSTVEENTTGTDDLDELSHRITQSADNLKAVDALARTLRDRLETQVTKFIRLEGDHQAETERLNNLTERQAETLADHGDRLDANKRLWQGTATDLANLTARLERIARQVDDLDPRVNWCEVAIPLHMDDIDAIQQRLAALDIQQRLAALEQSAWSRFADRFSAASTRFWSRLFGTRK